MRLDSNSVGAEVCSTKAFEVAKVVVAGMAAVCSTTAQVLVRLAVVAESGLVSC